MNPYCKKILLILFSFSLFIITVANARTNDADWYEMPIQWQDSLPAPVDMSLRVHHRPAGKHGYIKVVDKDRLQFDDGTAARFWGVVMAVSTSTRDGGLPPAKKDAAIIADKLASYGFNHVRFVGFDGHAPQALQHWKKTGVIKSKQIDRLDYFIAELRKRGIYYSFSINNSSAELMRYESSILANAKESKPYKRYRNTRMFDTTAMDLMVKWTKAFYSRKNPYTDLVYARDPANIYVSAVNEDTANIVRFNKGRTLSKEWKRRINDLFNAHLHGKYKTEKDLNKAWSSDLLPTLLIGESYRGSDIDLFTRVSHSLLPPQRISDIHEFLIDMDMLYTGKMRDMLVSIGFKGLITGTNKWYGLASLYNNYQAGDYINGHDYFGGLKVIKREKGAIIKTKITNKDFINLLDVNPDKALDDTRFALNRILPAHLIDRPYISSEWNHIIWDDHAYQGPIIMSSYASLNGIDGLNIHKFYNHPRPSYKDAYPRNVLAVASNPLLTALMPTLSLAYIRGDIKEYENKRIYCYAEDLDAYRTIWHRRPKVPKQLKKLFKEQPFGAVRVAMLEGCSVKQKALPENDAPAPVSFTTVKRRKTHMTINTERYTAIVGNLNAGHKVSTMQVELEQAGSVTLISLDGKPLQSSECSLLTIIGPTKNTGMNTEYQQQQKVIDGLGQWPPLLRGNKGRITLDVDKDKKYRLVPLSFKDSLHEIDASQVNGEMILNLENQQTPWFILTSNDCDSSETEI